MRKKTKKKNLILIVSLLLLSVLVILTVIYLIYSSKEKNRLLILAQKQEISSHYGEIVKTTKKTKLYKLENSTFVEVGTIGKDQELVLSKVNITDKTKKFKIDNFNDYYVSYKDVEKITSLTEKNNRYKKYIPYNKNIITKEVTNFYEESGELVYTINESFDLPIILNKKDDYGVEYENKLLYIKKENVEKTYDHENTKLSNTPKIPVLNYHFFYDDTKSSERSDCNQSICLSTANLKKHLDYIRDNNIFTPTMKEFEMYIDKQIQLPKSVVITIDDGWRADIGTKIITEYKLNATAFLISKVYEPNWYENDYIEVHSHGHNIHNAGYCPGGQGGAIKCVDRKILLADLKASREKLHNTTIFCYPFYEYNEYSISILKEAGFTMAFAGTYEAGKTKAEPGIDKYRIPRYVILIDTTVNEIKNIIN